MTYVIIMALSFFIAVVVVPMVGRRARAAGIFDRIGERKIHTGQIPRLGGVGIAGGFFVAALVVFAVMPIRNDALDVDLRLWVALIAAGGYWILGLVDDFRPLKARLKFIVQFALAIAVVAAGSYFRVIEFPIKPYSVDLGWVGPALTVFWIVGITNAFNLIDGMDGFAGGMALIGAVVWTLLFFKEGQYLPALVAVAMAGSVFGFLFYNFPPASIFMGDSGSLLLGYLLAVLPLLGSQGSMTDAGLIPAITICFIPILDTFAAILRRWKQGVSFFTPDRYHVHHKLLNLGFSTRQILAIIYSLCAALGATVLASVYLNPRVSFILMMIGWAVCGAIFIALHYLKENKVRFFDSER
ncbi:MAG TPA: MraY family glycosyltransferase [Rectinemataceae bacterium]|nr:MraY family glycosyltransferase [Rectinemataceae bacterium]